MREVDEGWTPGMPVSSSLAWPVVKAQVLARAWLGRCEWCGQDLPEDAHHRLLKGQGGPDRCWNLTGVSRICHGYIQTHPVEAQGRGFIVESCDDPVTVPMRLWNGALVRLDDQYGYEFLEWPAT